MRTMAKKTTTRKNNRRVAKRRSVRPRPAVNFPPTIPFNRCFMDVILRSVSVNGTMPINSRLDISLTVSDVFSGPWVGLRACFSQIKIKRLHVYVSAGVGYNTSGYHAINVAPKAEFEITGKTPFHTMLALPGTKAGKITRMISGVWYPTMPNDRNWMKTDSSTALVDYTYMSNNMLSDGKATATYPCEVTIDVHVRLRGVNYSALVSRAGNDESIEEEFEHLAT